jgi:hypothetical protein
MLLTVNRNITSKVYILVVHYTGEDISDELRRILRGNRYKIKSKTVRENEVELAAEIVVQRDNLSFLNLIRDLPSVKDAAVIQYSGEYNG